MESELHRGSADEKIVFGKGKDNSSLIYTFEPGILKREGGHCYENVCGTLRANAGDNQMAVAYTLKLRGGV